MVDIIFNTEKGFRLSHNQLVPINSDYVIKGGSVSLGNLSKTNIFIGENNSGKSRFLRYLFQTPFLSINNENVENLLTALRTYIITRDIVGKYGLSKFNSIYDSVIDNPRRYANTDGVFFSNLEKLSSSAIAKDKYYFPIIRGVKDYKTIINTKLATFLNATTLIQNKDSINHYISLLNLDKNGLQSFDIYREIIVNEYFKSINNPSELNIMTGGNLYKTIKSMLLGEEKDRKLISEFQTFLRETFFTDYESLQIIPNEDKKVLYLKIGNDERAIYDWGDGTQQLIVILFSLFIHKDEKDKLFFIEEPEIYLHPGILRKFIEVINSDVFPNHQYFITTHSNAILDVSADTNINMSIFKFTKNKNNENDEATFVIEQCNSGDVSLLNVLGVRNSSVFLSNCSIWVEGITDRLYLKHYLNLYFKKNGNINRFRENIDYTFIEYGGNNITHFNFDEEDSNDINAKYINNRIFLIADNDNTKSGTKKAERKKHFEEILGKNFYELPVTEIENLLPQKAIEDVLIKQNPDYAGIIKHKFEGERKYKNTKLGNYIDKTLFKDVGLRKYAAESGTIKNKLAFCQTAIEFIDDYDMLTDEAKELVEKIVAFIQANA